MSKLKITLIDYGVGNTHSVSNAISFLGYKNLKISFHEKVIKESDVLKKGTTEIIYEKQNNEEITISKNNDENCYDYLTELIRSSNFPFENIKKEKVNTLIDEDNGEIIRAKLFFDTEGTGTIGWVEYHFKDRILLNTSANREEPETLKFNIDYAKKFESCKSHQILGRSQK